MEEVNDLTTSIVRNDDEMEESEEVSIDADDADELDVDAARMEPLRRRDEVREVRKMSSKDTFRLRLWRIVVTGVLLLTALTVTLTTYALLQQQEEENFQIAVRFHTELLQTSISTRSKTVLTQMFCHHVLFFITLNLLTVLVVRSICSYSWRCRS
jgi:hypothetical protein